MKPSVFQWGNHLFYRATGDNAPEFLRPNDRPTPVKAGSARDLLARADTSHLWVIKNETAIACDQQAINRLLNIARDTGAGLVYADFTEVRGRALHPHPLNDYQEGSLRDDFDFGPMFVLSTRAAENAISKYGPLPRDAGLALYDLRLKISTDTQILHIPEFLYRASAAYPAPVKQTTSKTEAHFSYTARENAVRQKKFEKIAASHLKRIGAFLPPRTKKAGKTAGAQWKASVIIPVRNRKKTIAEALASALAQKTDFPFNIIVVDNHSTDGTTGIIKKIASRHPHVHHLIPALRGLGIGGCWNEAIFSPQCGRYAVQLDSDDLYSSPETLQKIVDTLIRGSYAMVVGSYTLVDERLRPIGPGLIDHREWTKTNGHNNLLRVNGIGAPRAFDTEVLRKTCFPDVSFGEDYAVALSLTREYKIGRIFESLYLCRRWSDNTDAELSLEKQNRHNHYKDRLRTLEIKARQKLNRGHDVARPDDRDASQEQTSDETSESIYAVFSGRDNEKLGPLCNDFFKSEKEHWPELGAACRVLAKTKRRKLESAGYVTALQYNPARQKSGSAAVDPVSISRRPCFLCHTNRPPKQRAIAYRDTYEILCNPAPIFGNHFTVVSNRHTPQEISSSVTGLLQIARDASPEYLVFYNGPACGASAPDHLHFQMIPAGELPFLGQAGGLPLLKQTKGVRIAGGFAFDRALVIIESRTKTRMLEQFNNFLKAARKTGRKDVEPPVNIICSYGDKGWRLTIFLRAKHRPDAYYATGRKRILVSPGAIDMAGTLVVPLEHDLQRLNAQTISAIYREVSLDEKAIKGIADLLQQVRVLCKGVLPP